MKKKLLTLYLKHDNTFKSLSSIALSQLILKLIFVCGEGVKRNLLKEELNNITHTKISKKDFDKSIEELINENKIFHKDEGFYFDNNYRVKIESAFNENEICHQNVIENWFENTECDKSIVRNWFEDLTITFFEKFSYEWIHEICKNPTEFSKNTLRIRELIESSFNNYNTISDKDKNWLAKQYLKFLDSDRSEDINLLWAYGTSKFSTTLLTARLFGDNLSLEYLKNATLILDTNILMILGLEGYEFSKSLENMENIFLKYGIKTKHLPISRKEYQRVIENKKIEVLNVFKNYSIEVLMKVDDCYIRTLIKRNQTDEEEITQFFNSLYKIPDRFFNRLKIELLDDDEVNMIVCKASQDNSIKNRINEINIKRWNRPRRENALIHDAGLLQGAQFIRKKENCWILTKDGTIKQYAIENIIRDEFPIAISMDVLINLMVYYIDDIDIDPTSFAPLFVDVIKLSLIPEKNAFTLADLSYILDTKIQINELPDEKVTEIAQKLNKIRISGASEEEASLFLRREFQNEKLKIKTDLEKSQIENQFLKDEKEEMIKERDLFIEEFRNRRKGELHDEYDGKLRKNKLMIFLILPLVLLILTSIVILFIQSNSKFEIIASAISIEIIGSILFSNYYLKPKILSKYSEKIIGIDIKVSNEIKELISKKKNKIIMKM
ncbi:MAG: hypothetical protein NTX22_00285 [Ignavibacteriales bacterium]|nr:hypothetical protein [Ignavibacteriales bacterium]